MMGIELPERFTYSSQNGLHTVAVQVGGVRVAVARETRDEATAWLRDVLGQVGDLASCTIPCPPALAEWSMTFSDGWWAVSVGSWEWRGASGTSVLLANEAAQLWHALDDYLADSHGERARLRGMKLPEWLAVGTDGTLTATVGGELLTARHLHELRARLEAVRTAAEIPFVTVDSVYTPTWKSVSGSDGWEVRVADTVWRGPARYALEVSVTLAMEALDCMCELDRLIDEELLRRPYDGEVK